MKAIRFIGVCTIWITAIAIFIYGLLLDFPISRERWLPVSIFTVPISLILSVIGYMYYYLDKSIKNEIFFYVKEISFWYLMCFCLYFLTYWLDGLGFKIPFLKEIVVFLRTIVLVPSLLGISQLITIIIFIIRKKGIVA